MHNAVLVRSALTIPKWVRNSSAASRSGARSRPYARSVTLMSAMVGASLIAPGAVVRAGPRVSATYRRGQRLDKQSAGRRQGVDFSGRPGLLSASMANALVRNWRMVACRGGLAILFGLSVLLWPDLRLDVLVTLFAAYALLDGVYTLASVLARAGEHPLEWWPVAVEGAVGVGLGVLALVWPFVPYRMIWLIAFWGIVTGVLEVVLSSRLPRDLESHWLLAMGGVASLFLAVLVLILPHAVAGDVARILGAYALVFGVLITLVALRLRRRARTPAST
jgi:uncharacterized membrane protein HdeD (DUF308 family)